MLYPLINSLLPDYYVKPTPASHCDSPLLNTLKTHIFGLKLTFFFWVSSPHRDRFSVQSCWVSVGAVHRCGPPPHISLLTKTPPRLQAARWKEDKWCAEQWPTLRGLSGNFTDVIFSNNVRLEGEREKKHPKRRIESGGGLRLCA